MDKTSLIIQNRLHEATVSLERAHLIYCDENWKCDYSVPPFSSIGLILQGEGVICIVKKTHSPDSRPAIPCFLPIHCRPFQHLHPILITNISAILRSAVMKQISSN